jgi:hypothetical protein
MKHVIALAVIAVTCTLTILQAQVTLRMDPCPAFASGDIWSVNRVEANLIHSGDSTIDIAWERTYVDIPDGWISAVIDPNMNHAPFLDEPLGPDGTLMTFPIGAGDTIPGNRFYVLFNPFETAGTGVVHFKVYELANPSNHVLCTYTFSTVASSTVDPSMVDPAMGTLHMAPNPARDYIRVHTSSHAALRYVQLYSSIGQLVRTVDMGSPMTELELDLSTLEDGMYIARIMNASGEPIGSKRFCKQP